MAYPILVWFFVFAGSSTTVDRINIFTPRVRKIANNWRHQSDDNYHDKLRGSSLIKGWDTINEWKHTLHLQEVPFHGLGLHYPIIVRKMI